ncbi:hypothetical protein LCGC14_1551050 [marine sediment metagenome]|uniref:Uncharacterized protein n=1 Tax=marine sediment metagenome TaxID=412755 RepID=A0A0F9IQD7_9ZZZZ
MVETSGQALIRGVDIQKGAIAEFEEALIIRALISSKPTKAREIKFWQKTTGYLTLTAPAKISNIAPGARPFVAETSWTPVTKYSIKYMLDSETKDSDIFLSIDLLDNPFEYKLDIEENNQIKKYQVDLIETFNYLAGIFVDKIITKQDNNVDYIAVIGKREDKRVIVIWRNKNSSFDPVKDKEFVEKEIIADEDFDEIFVNGSSLIENAISLDLLFKAEMMGGL